MWEDCLQNYVFPTLDRASHMVSWDCSDLNFVIPFLLLIWNFCFKAATSSRDEWHGKELGTRGGKAVHMLIHHRYMSFTFFYLATFTLFSFLFLIYLKTDYTCHYESVCSRNTAQKQWDETLVLVLGGIARILRTFFPFLRNLKNFQSGNFFDRFIGSTI